MSDSDSYVYEYSDDEDEDQTAINIENQFYEAEKCDDNKTAIDLFKEVINQEKESSSIQWY